jgi:hypothetical protein
MLEGEAFVVDAHAVQQGSLQIVYMQAVAGDQTARRAQRVGLPSDSLPHSCPITSLP